MNDTARLALERDNQWTELALDLVRDARGVQERMKAEGRFTYTCADPEMSDPERFAVLGEEVGEVARCVLEAGRGTPHATRGALRHELSQVAAVAVAWIERLDQETLSRVEAQKAEPRSASDGE